MLSVLIPIFNYDVRPFVSELIKQQAELKQTVEIICVDDGSLEDYKILNSQIEGIYYEELPSNIGRSAIRNYLASLANQPYLLFVDCDSKCFYPNYLKLYVENISENAVIYGGRLYDDEKPQDNNLILRWKYGRERESADASKRNTHPYHYFLTNNFVIPKDKMNTLSFSTDLIGYGHEDTQFAFQLRKIHIPIIHIDNPLIHKGLENNQQFITKTKEGVKNLSVLIKSGTVEDQVKLYRVFKSISTVKLRFVSLFILRILHPLIIKNLLSSNPNLKMFDLLKLSELLKINPTIK